MITLITGGPGTGKTAWLVAQLLELQKNQKFRSLYVHGVRELKIPNTTIYCHSPLCDLCRSYESIPDDALYVENWPEWKHKHDLIVVDEIQRVWRSSNGAVKPSDAVAALETHRHYGIDFWVITQSPRLVHANLKALVGRHIHLVAKWSGRTEYEWAECQDNVQARTDAVLRPYKLPKHVYNLYSSAEVHTKQDKRKPLSFYAAIASLVIAAIVVSYVVIRMSARISPQKEAVVLGEGGVATAGAAPPLPSSSSNDAAYNTSTYPDFKPTVEGVPESAPAYSELLKVTAVPLLVGCVYSKITDVCSCYTAQATPYPASKDYCLAQIKNKRFNPYLQSVHTVQKQDEQSN